MIEQLSLAKGYSEKMLDALKKNQWDAFAELFSKRQSLLEKMDSPDSISENIEAVSKLIEELQVMNRSIISMVELKQGENRQKLSSINLQKKLDKAYSQISR